MLSCEVKSPQRDVRIARAHYLDATSVSESDYERSRFHQTPRYQNVTALWQSHKPTDTEDELNRHYVNIPRSVELIMPVPSRPRGGAGNISLKADLSPMSLRAHTVEVPGVQSPMLVQVALFRLNESGFYYGSISHSDARRLLQSQPPGTFLVRASSLSAQQLDEHFLFSLTVRVSGTLW